MWVHDHLLVDSLAKTSYQQGYKNSCNQANCKACSNIFYIASSSSTNNGPGDTSNGDISEAGFPIVGADGTYIGANNTCNHWEPDIECPCIHSEGCCCSCQFDDVGVYGGEGAKQHPWAYQLVDSGDFIHIVEIFIGLAFVEVAGEYTEDGSKKVDHCGSIIIKVNQLLGVDHLAEKDIQIQVGIPEDVEEYLGEENPTQTYSAC